MPSGPLSDRIVSVFDSLPAQLQAAARYVLDRPREVALLSMREQARQAGVQPATMTRLAKALGLGGYDELRQAYADALRGEAAGFLGKADAHLRQQKLKGDHALAAEMLAALGAQLASLAEPHALDELVAAAARLHRARRIYCLGLRSSHPAAWQLHYILSLIGEKTVLLDSSAGVGADAVGAATAQDVLLAASVQPYTRLTVETASFAQARGVPVVAITDSVLSPLAKLAASTIVVPTESPSFLHSMSPAFVVAEILGALVAGRGGKAALEALARVDHQLAALNVFFTPGAPAGSKSRSKA
ncbi:MAG TPA: MurR/RpiR family transcriptional regulator [Kiloniellaceae bacterium]